MLQQTLWGEFSCLENSPENFTTFQGCLQIFRIIFLCNYQPFCEKSKNKEPYERMGWLGDTRQNSETRTETNYDFLECRGSNQKLFLGRGVSMNMKPTILMNYSAFL